MATADEITRIAQDVHNMLGKHDTQTTTAVLSGVLALHLSQLYGPQANEMLDREFVPMIRALTTYHLRGKEGLQ